MKTCFILTLLTIFAFSEVSAQEYSPRKRYINLSYSSYDLKLDDSSPLKSNFGAAFTVGKTYFLHKKPVAGMLRFGIDATWFDANYANYEVEYPYDEEYDEIEKTNYHQVELGMQVGPSITISPLKKLNIQGYFRYAPSFSALYADEGVYGNYASLFVTGARVTYRFIGLGVEYRFGNSNYKEIGGDDEDGEENMEDMEEYTPTKLKANLSGLRAYITFRF